MKTVAVSGGFDPLHIGHIRHFKAAKKLGDRLVLILNSDRFLKEKKGYVFMPFEQRKEVLESVRWVDEVVPCIDADSSVAETLEKIKPHIFAKGGDRNIDNIPEKEREVCKRLNIRVVSNVGEGGKVQSSSWLVEDVVEQINSQRKEG